MNIPWTLGRKRARNRLLVCLGLCMLPRVWMANDVVHLQFDNPMTAVINATHWDRIQGEWAVGEDRDARFFDAAYRFLLVRFPGSAEALHDHLRRGYAIESAELVLVRAACPWPRSPGYRSRADALRDAPEPEWRVAVSALRRPWKTDPELGPTWNAYIQGAGWWRKGGARALADRFPDPLDECEISIAHPQGRLNVSAVFRTSGAEFDSATCLRQVEDHGFLVRRTELSHYRFGSGQLTTGAVPLYVHPPVLVMTLEKTGEAPSADVPPLPPPVDVTALARHLRQSGEGGFPATRKPGNLAELVQQWRERRRGDMPDWMWTRVREVWDLPYYQRGETQADADSITALVKALDSADPRRYEAVVMPWELDLAPGFFKGHMNIQDSLPMLFFPELLTEVVRYDRELSLLARDALPHRPDILNCQRFLVGMGTFNHLTGRRPAVLLGAEVTGKTELSHMMHFSMINLNRQVYHTWGFTQEMGDSYYRGIALAPLQTAAHFLQDPFLRLKASLMLEKLLFEDIITYHPGLRHRVSRASRRMRGLHEYALGQHVPEAMLHTLSRQGVLIETDRLAEGPELHGMPIIDMHPVPPVHVALIAPWGAEWETHAIDDKAFPFRAVMKNYGLGTLDEPVHTTTYMGHNYALASEQTHGPTVPVFAAWRTHARPVERLSEMGIMMLQGRANDMEADNVDKTPMASMQHGNKLVYVTRPPERKFWETGFNNVPASNEEGIFNYRAQAAIHTWGREALPEVWIGDRNVERLPATASHDDVIFVRDGVTYISFMPLPATDLGRDRDILIEYSEPSLTIASHILDRPETVELTEELWAALAEATAGWVVEFGDVQEHGSFDAFREHIRAAVFSASWDAERRVLDIAYESGGDRMEMGFNPDFERAGVWHGIPVAVSTMMPYQKVNGRNPWLPESVYLDSPLGIMGTSEVLEKGGARLVTQSGQMAVLRREPVSATVSAINPFMDLTPFRLTTPEGIEVISEGPLSLARIVVRPRENELRVDYRIPRSSHLDALRKIREEFVLVPGGAYIWDGHARAIQGGVRYPVLMAMDRPPFFPGEALPVETIPQRAARALRVRGFDGPPRVILNGEELAGPFADLEMDGRGAYRIPIVRSRP